jgi:hypothetical protein
MRKSCVCFFVEASDLDDARRKAAAGDWTDFEDIGATVDDWTLDDQTVEPCKQFETKAKT